MRCLHVSRLVRAELVQEIEQDGVIVRTAMSRGRGIVEMFTAETVPCFGWQIQEGQYRLVYLTGCARGPGPTRREARAYSDYFCFDQARILLGDTGPERPVTAPNAPLAFGGFASDFVYRSIPAQDLTIKRVVTARNHLCVVGFELAHRRVGQGTCAAECRLKGDGGLSVSAKPHTGRGALSCRRHSSRR